MLFLACAQTSKAQEAAKTPPPPAIYRLLSKGEPMPYTGVATELETYRLETKKIKKMAELIAEQAKENSGLKKEVATADSTATAYKSIIADQRRLLNSSQATATVLQDANIDLVELREEVKPKWYERPLVVGPISFVAGATVTGYFIYKATR